MIDSNIESRLMVLLNEAARNLNLDNFSINLNPMAEKGDGFLGSIYKASILDKTTNSKTYVIVKAAPEHKEQRNQLCIDSAYKNEIHLYTEIIPTFIKFQQECGISNIYNWMPRHLASIKERYREMIALEDLTSLGYQMWQKDILFDDEHVSFIFRTYGKFHALSFCMKDQKPEEYAALTKHCHNVLLEYKDKTGFSRSLRAIAARCLGALDSVQDTSVRENYQKYVNNTMEIYSDTVQYKGKYSSILHGDCWSNNMMFKYQNPGSTSGLESINLIDFQFVSVGTPVFDLSYFFYSGSSKALFKKLEYFLDMYYESFSSFAKELGSDPQKIFPRQVLSDDWRKYCKFGMLLSLLLVHVKLMSKKESAEVAEVSGKSDTSESKFLNSNVNDNLFNERIRDILVHMHEIEAL